MRSIFLYIIISAMLFASCADVLDKTDLNVLDQDHVFMDEVLAQAYVDARYLDNLPEPDTYISGGSDESGGNAYNSLFGQLTIDNTTDIWDDSYRKIRDINIGIEGILGGTLPADVKDRLVAPLMVMRAWRYWEMIKLYGGVPIITKVQDKDVDDLNVSRNKTSECINQIIKDLDDASALLPNTAETGRFTKGVALAIKGRVLLYYASELFNPSGESQRWQDAYDANKAAKEQLENNEGKALYNGPYADIWFDEDNSEAVFYTKYQTSSNRTHSWDACTRPLEESANCTGANHPTWDFVKSYPMKNGLQITDPNSEYDASAYWLNRDPRFDATIVVNASIFELSGKQGRRQWTFSGGEANGGTTTGFYCRKAINTGFDALEAQQSGTDWLELRFTEVLMNLAEAANEVGERDEAFEILKKVRGRAGIEAGDGRYGLPAGVESDIDEMRKAIMFERKIEFAFEGKRFWDLKRRRMFDQVLNGTRREKVVINLNAGVTMDIISALDQEEFDNNYQMYFDEQVLPLDVEFIIDFKDEYYFLPIAKGRLEENPNIEQSIAWGGNFDPLK